MRKLAFLMALVCLITTMNAQLPGDTIKIKSFKYGSTTRDTMIAFPNNNLTFEKIIMKYNMRCKNNLVSTQAAPNQGCGEWDYSCNTYIVDSTKVESDLNTAPSHIVSNFSGNNFVYTSQTVYDYYNFMQNTVVLNNIISETQYTLGTGSTAVPNFLKANERSGRSQILYTAAELTSAGFVAGNISGLLLNVANSGGTVNFFKVGMQHSSATVLNGNAPTVTGFTNVYNSNYSFVSGNNRVQFHTPFVWNGTSNVLVDFSFTNTNPSTAIIFNGSAAGSTMALYANNNNALSLAANGHVNVNTSLLNSVTNEISVAFWAYGNAASMPSDAQFIYAYDNIPGHRQFSLQLPWGDNNVYFDCGYTNNGYDRLNKIAAASEQGGQWNHWAFTKNAATGAMRIYLNGVLWASAAGKVKPITIMNMILGKDQNMQNNWRGKMNELSIWNKELSLPDIQNWMNKPLNATHPFYTNLLAYYKANEGTGSTITDSKNNLTSAGVNVQWTYDRGHTLTRMFSETNLRPNVVFLKGTYALTTSTIVVKDSVARNPNIVQQFTVVNNAGQGLFVNDAVNVIATTNQYQTLPIKIYDGDTGLLTGTMAVTPQATLNIGTLNYYNRYPFYNEIMSFVTPYGKGLNLGIGGKSWYYDVSDFAPILKGNKRMMMTLGGEYQEQMDIDFWFIVGTPPRTVLEFNQLWQGAARAGGASIGSINNNTRFGSLSVPVLSNGQAFKLRSTITGHGAQGEFKQNGGTVNHFFNVNGGADEFSWQLTEKCAYNPVYPQGGTWCYDREGWCPGQNSLLKEYDLNPYITPGATATLDYNTSSPPMSAGDYRYIVANQFITYGGANKTLDAAIIDVLAPSDKVLYSRANPMCANPVILIRNTGSDVLTSVDLEYWINNSTNKQTFTWNGNLDFMDTAVVVLPIGNLWVSDLQTSGNIFKAEIKKTNALTDQYSFNNIYRSAFVVPEVQPQIFTIDFKTNLSPQENSYTLYDDFGNVVGSNSFANASTSYLDDYDIAGCFRLVVEDTGEDGLQWFANPAQGSGQIRLRNAAGTVIKSFVSDFGKGFEYSFTTSVPVYASIEKNIFASGINLYPNPTHSKFTLASAELEGAEFIVTTVLGQVVEIPAVKTRSAVEFDASSLTPGVYFITITKDGDKATKKINVY